MTETKSQSHLDNNTILICRPGNRIVWYISDVVVPWVQYWVFFFQWLRRFRSADVCIRRMMGLNSCSHRAEKRTVWKEIWEPDAADEKLVQFKICEPFRRSPRSFSSSETLRGIAYQKDSQRGGKGGGSSAPPHQLLSPLPPPSPSLYVLFSTPSTFSSLTRTHNSGIVTETWHLPRSPVGREGTFMSPWLRRDRKGVRRRVRWVWLWSGCPGGKVGTFLTVRHTPYTYHWNEKDKKKLRKKFYILMKSSIP